MQSAFGNIHSRGTELIHGVEMWFDTSGNHWTGHFEVPPGVSDLVLLSSLLTFYSHSGGAVDFMVEDVDSAGTAHISGSGTPPTL